MQSRRAEPSPNLVPTPSPTPRFVPKLTTPVPPFAHQQLPTMIFAQKPTWAPAGIARSNMTFFECPALTHSCMIDQQTAQDKEIRCAGSHLHCPWTAAMRRQGAPRGGRDATAPTPPGLDVLRGVPRRRALLQNFGHHFSQPKFYTCVSTAGKTCLLMSLF